jgi:hypothetical protein
VEKGRENGIHVYCASMIAVIRLHGDPIEPAPKSRPRSPIRSLGQDGDGSGAEESIVAAVQMPICAPEHFRPLGLYFFAMSSQDEIDAEQSALALQAKQIAQINVDSLVRGNELGTELGFEVARPVLTSLQNVFRELAAADLRLLTSTKVSALTSLVGQVNQQFETLRSFRPSAAASPRQTRDAIVNSLRELADRCFDEISKVVAYSNAGQTSSFTTRASESLATLQQTQAEANNALAELKSTLDKARQAAQQVGVVQHAQFFKEESDGHQKAAKTWLTVTILLTVLAVCVGWWNYSHSLDALTSAISKSPQPETPQNGSKQASSDSGTMALQIQLAVAKLIIFSVLFSAVIWTGKMYRAHRHNYVINRHRLNALSTFEAFAKATDDQQIKNAVLLQATQCIFGPQPTGYISGENESEGYPQILEIVRGMGAGDKGK